MDLLDLAQILLFCNTQLLLSRNDNPDPAQLIESTANERRKENIGVGPMNYSFKPLTEKTNVKDKPPY